MFFDPPFVLYYTKEKFFSQRHPVSQLNTHVPPNPTCSRWYGHECLKADYSPPLLPRLCIAPSRIQWLQPRVTSKSGFIFTHSGWHMCVNIISAAGSNNVKANITVRLYKFAVVRSKDSWTAHWVHVHVTRLIRSVSDTMAQPVW